MNTEMLNVYTSIHDLLNEAWELQESIGDHLEILQIGGEPHAPIMNELSKKLLFREELASEVGKKILQWQVLGGFLELTQEEPAAQVEENSPPLLASPLEQETNTNLHNLETTEEAFHIPVASEIASIAEDHVLSSPTSSPAPSPGAAR